MMVHDWHIEERQYPRREARRGRRSRLGFAGLERAFGGGGGVPRAEGRPTAEVLQLIRVGDGA